MYIMYTAQITLTSNVLHLKGCVNSPLTSQSGTFCWKSVHVNTYHQASKITFGLGSEESSFEEGIVNAVTWTVNPEFKSEETQLNF